MTVDVRVLQLTVRGVPLCDETLHYVRRCNHRMLARAGVAGRPLEVRIERRRSSAEVDAYVAFSDDASSPGARGRDLDVLLAVREAFDRLTLLLLESSAQARACSPPRVVDESLG